MPQTPSHDEQPQAAEKPAGGLWRQASRFSYVGIFFGVSIVIGYLAGHWIEGRWGGAPWVSLAGVLFGVATGFRELIRAAQAYNKENKSS